MRTITKYAMTASVLACLAAAVPASATTYVGTRAIGVNNVDLSITTDDTIGDLSAANILDWTIAVTGFNDFTLFGPASGNNSTYSGGFFTATATDLLFNFDQPPSSLRFQATAFDYGFYCLNCFGNTESLGDGFGFYGNVNRQGIVSIAQAQGGIGAVPEPATWALLILGFGMVGAAMRRRHSVAVEQAFA